MCFFEIACIGKRRLKQRIRIQLKDGPDLCNQLGEISVALFVSRPCLPLCSTPKIRKSTLSIIHFRTHRYMYTYVHICVNVFVNILYVNTYIYINKYYCIYNFRFIL